MATSISVLGGGTPGLLPGTTPGDAINGGQTGLSVSLPPLPQRAQFQSLPVQPNQTRRPPLLPTPGTTQAAVSPNLTSTAPLAQTVNQQPAIIDAFNLAWQHFNASAQQQHSSEPSSRSQTTPRLTISRPPYGPNQLGPRPGYKRGPSAAHDLVFTTAYNQLDLMIKANYSLRLFGVPPLNATPLVETWAEPAAPNLIVQKGTTKPKGLNYVKNVSRSYQPLVYSSRAKLVRYLRTEILINNSSVILSDTDVEALSLGPGFVLHADFDSKSPTLEATECNEAWKLKISHAIHGERQRLQPGKTPTERKGVLESSGRLDGPIDGHDPLNGHEWTNDRAFRRHNEALLAALTCTSRPEESSRRRPLFDSIQALGRNKKIHVIQADKGGVTVVMDTVDYDRESHRQLEEKKTYTELTKQKFDNGLRKTACTVRDIVVELFRSGNVSQNEYDVFIGKLTALDGSYIYFLPKIHKEWNEQINAFPGRPIAATFACVVNTLDKYITELTKPLLSIIPGSLRDTLDLLAKLPKGRLSKKAKLVTADVNSLYPNIPWEGGIDAATAFYADNIKFLREFHRRNGLAPPPSVQTFCDAVTAVIKGSFISFKGQRFFKQASGTSMGSCISVYLANAYMFQLTKHLIPPTGFAAQKRPSWLLFFERFIDDLIVIVDDCSQQQIDDLFSGISNETISYTTTEPDVSATALDVQLSICPETYQIVTEPYSKPTSKQTFLHARSTHPAPSIGSLPYAQFLRLRRIASTEEAFNRHAARLTDSLILRDYPIGVIRKALARARTKSRDELLSRAGTSGSKRTSDTTRGPSIKSSFKYITKYRSDVNWNKAKRLLKVAHAAAARHYSTRSRSSDKDAIAERLLTQKTSAIVFAVHNNTRAMLTSNYKRPLGPADRTQMRNTRRPCQSKP